MPSPFPGMNPYLERPGVWHELHEALIFLIRSALVRVTPKRYAVRSDLTVYVRELPDDERTPIGLPDVFVTDTRDASNAAASATAVAPPPPSSYGFNPELDAFTEQTIEIRDQRDDRVVTAIEVLSPENKRNREGDRGRYLRKRLTYIGAGTNLLEIDLLRGGKRQPLRTPLPDADYMILLTRARERERVAQWPVALRQPLPPVPVPLAHGDADVTLDLQSLVHEAYDRGGFDRYAYDRPPKPKLSPDDAAWARSLVPAPASPR